MFFTFRLFQSRQKNVGSVNIFNNKTKTLTQKFIEAYNKIEAQYDLNTPQQKIYEEALDLLKKERESKKDILPEEEEEFISLAKEFKDAQTKTPQVDININVKDIFKV